MKIVLISSGVIPVFPNGYGGLENVVGNLAVCLDRIGHDVYVIAPDGSDIGGVGNIKLIGCGPCDPDARAWESRAYEKYAPMLLSPEFEDAIIHDHTWAKAVYLLKMRHTRLNVMSTLHGMLPYQTPPPVPQCNMVGISKHHAETISQGLKIPVRHVYNGIDLGRYPFGEGPRNDRYLFLARMTPFKGAHLFTKAIVTKGLKGDLVGDDEMVEDKGFVEQLMRACGSGNGVCYRGGVSRERAAKFFRESKCYVLPCTGGWQEPFGLTVVEAMASGCPVIVTPSGALPELVADGFSGYVVQEDQLQDFLDDDKINAISPMDCHLRALKFSREEMTKNYEILYREVLSGGGW